MMEWGLVSRERFGIEGQGMQLGVAGGCVKAQSVETGQHESVLEVVSLVSWLSMTMWAAQKQSKQK